MQCISDLWLLWDLVAANGRHGARTSLFVFTLYSKQSAVYSVGVGVALGVVSR
jgi:hypothetical protein